MSVLLKSGDTVSVPPAGYKSLILDVNGDPFLLLPDGTREEIGGGGGGGGESAAPVSGDGSEATPFTIADGAIALAKMADLANARVIGRNTSGTGVPEAVTMAQLITLLSAGGLIAMADAIATAGADAQDLTLSGLDGDADGEYDFSADILYKGGVGLASFFLRPIGATDTGLVSWIRYNNGSGTTTAAGPLSNWAMFSENNASNQHLLYKGWISSKTGRIRQAVYTCDQVRTGGGVKNAFVTGWITDTATAITGLTVHSDVAGAIAAGSYIKVRKRKSIL
jgi:hypothetical protein